MNALNLDNWICDLYSRIDAQRYITGLDQRQYRDEIHWAYRLGYLTREEYYQLLEYLDTMMIEKKKKRKPSSPGTYGTDCLRAGNPCRQRTLQGIGTGIVPAACPL